MYHLKRRNEHDTMFVNNLISNLGTSKNCWGELSLSENNKAVHSPTLHTAGFF